MTITNVAPIRMVLPSAGVVPSYTQMYIGHQIPTDADVVGKSFWVTAGGTTTQRTFTDLTRAFTIIDNLASDTEYSILGAFYDQIIDSELLAARVGIQLSNEVQATTATPPSITDTTVSSQQLDVGVGSPVVTFTLAGAGETIEIDREVTDGSTIRWDSVYVGGFQPTVSVPVPQGTYRFRVRGTIRLPDGLTVESSNYSITSPVQVTYQFEGPSEPTSLTIALRENRDGIQSYDLFATWVWERGTGADIREFVLEYARSSDFAAGGEGWDSATLVNVGVSTQAILTNFPLGLEYRFRVRAISWGPIEDATTYSAETTVIVNESLVNVPAPTPNTAVDIGRYGITAYNIDDDLNKTQTFRIDAATGNVAIGALDQGIAPVSVDGTTGNVNISGRTITDEIVAASVVLANLDGMDNPVIRTSTKTDYAQASTGMWAGFDNSDSQFKFDLGNPTQYIRWTGDTLLISGNVQVNTPNGNVSLLEGVQGNFVANIYIESATQPTTPTGNAYPPSGWSTSPITGASDPVWISTAVVSSQNNQVIDESEWSVPIRFTGQQGEDGVASVTIYRVGSVAPPTPNSLAIPPPGWSTTPPVIPAGQRLYASVGERVGTDTSITGTWSAPIQFSGLDGEQGDPGIGTRGAGIYAQPLTGFTTFNVTSANAFFTANFSSTPVLNDVLTQYDPSSPTTAETRRWNGSEWVQSSLTVHGDAVIDGTLAANKIAASSAFLNEAGINVIYDNTAFSSGDPEANFTMKIDLQEGSITIR